MDSTDIVSDQELEGEKDDACSSKEKQVQLEKDSDKSGGENMPIMEETDQPEEDKGKLEDVQDAEEEEREMFYPFFLCKNLFSGKEHNQVQQNEKRSRRGIVLSTVDSEISSYNQLTNEMEKMYLSR